MTMRRMKVRLPKAPRVEMMMLSRTLSIQIRYDLIVVTIMTMVDVLLVMCSIIIICTFMVVQDCASFRTRICHLIFDWIQQQKQDHNHHPLYQDQPLHRRCHFCNCRYHHQ